MYILSIDAKDLYDANHLVHMNPCGYDVRDSNGNLKLGRFINSLDYSLDLIKLREVYQRTYRNERFGFILDGKEYSQTVVNVTFKYSYKQWNQFVRYDSRLKENRTYYVLAGYQLDALTFKDRLAFEDDKLVGVCVNAPVNIPVSDTVLGQTFRFDSKAHVYRICANRNKTLMSCKQLREDLYANGFICDGQKYVRFKRSSGSSRVGKCLFIDESMAGRMRTWERCGIPIRNGQRLDLAGWEAYISLTLSSIIDTLEIRQENILLIDDYESTFNDRMMAIGYDGTQMTASATTTTITNCIWDGQALMDSSLFSKYPTKGMLLLRNRFFKSACFNTNIQEFFADNGITEVSQLNGKTRAKEISDIKLIVTPSSVKYLKFGSFDAWLDELEPNFGIVKFDKPTYFFDGQLVQTHYQLLNTLHMSREEVKELLKPSQDYFCQLDTNPSVFRRHVGCQGTAELGEHGSRDCFDCIAMNDVWYYLLGVNKKFAKTKLYADWKKKVLKAFKDNIRKGHILVRGTYATLLGNPYEMLQASIGKFDGTSLLGQGGVYCRMFEDGVELLGSRSPHVAAGNILCTTNKRHELLDRYFNLTPYIVCINSIEENILERLSGADMDSDTMLLTSDPLLVRKAQEHYEDFLVPTKLIPSEMKKREYTNESKADLDHVTADNRIGEIVNLSQELNSLMWDELNKGRSFEEIAPIYEDIAKLDVLSNIEIDRAKREYAVEAVKEMRRIHAHHPMVDKDGRRIKPFFFAYISRSKGYYNAKRNHYRHHETTMDYVQDEVLSWRADNCTLQYESINTLFTFPYYSEHRVRVQQAQAVYDCVRETKEQITNLWKLYGQESDDDKRRSIIREIDRIMRNRVEFLAGNNFSTSTIYWLLRHMEDKENADIRFACIKLLFGHPTLNMRRFLYVTEESVPKLVPHPDGKTLLYGIPFAELVV